MTPNNAPFHLAVHSSNIEETQDFYIEVIACSAGRKSENWIDLNFFGNQLVFHDKNHPAKVESKDVPIPHFGAVLEWQAWHQLRERLEKASCSFETYCRFEGEEAEQKTLFTQDPSGHNLEFKCFKDTRYMFE